MVLPMAYSNVEYYTLTALEHCAASLQHQKCTSIAPLAPFQGSVACYTCVGIGYRSHRISGMEAERNGVRGSRTAIAVTPMKARKEPLMSKHKPTGTCVLPQT